MITARQITRAIHAFAVRLHVGALRTDKKKTAQRAARTVKQTRLVQAAINKRTVELSYEYSNQTTLRDSTMIYAGATIDGIDRELAKYES